MVEDGAFSHIINYSNFFKEILNLEGQRFYLVVELHWEESESAACRTNEIKTCPLFFALK